MRDHLTTNTYNESGPTRFDGGAFNSKYLIDLLEFEINHVRSEESKPGWTTWALIASFASMLWLLTQQLEHEYDLRTTLFLFLLITLIYQSLFELSRALFATFSFRVGRFFTPSSELSKSRSSMLAIVLRNCFLLWITYTARSLLDPTSRIFIFLFFGFDSFVIIVGLFASFLNFPLPERPRAQMGLIRAIIVVPAMLGAIAGITTFWKEPDFTITEFRIGALLFGLSTVFLLLVKSQPKTPLLETLVDIRRSLVLGQVDIETARRSTEIALQGMRVSDALQGKLVDLLADLERGGFHLDAAAKEFEAFSKSFGERPSASPNDTQAMVSLVRQSFDRHMQELKTALDSFNAKLVKFQQRMHLYERLSPESKESLTLLRTRLDEAFRVFNSKQVTLIERARQFDQTVKQTLNNPHGR